MGDYYAGANHVLPTTDRLFISFRRARFCQTYPIYAIRRQQSKAQHDITTLAYAEGLQAHAKAIEVRNDNN
ncbi:MAG: histidinol dehydrogenase [Streptococcus sp.]